MAAKKKESRRVYSAEFKAEAVASMATMGAEAAAKKHGVPAGNVRNWAKAAGVALDTRTKAAKSNGHATNGHANGKPSTLPPIELTGLQAYVRVVVQQEIAAAIKRGFGA